MSGPNRTPKQDSKVPSGGGTAPRAPTDTPAWLAAGRDTFPPPPQFADGYLDRVPEAWDACDEDPERWDGMS